MIVKHLFNTLSDEELMFQLKAGNIKAFDEIYLRYSTKIWGYFFRMLWKNMELAQDCTQELFIKVLKNVEQFEEDKKFCTWIYSVANNMCKNEYRKNEQHFKHAGTLKNNLFVTQKNPDLQRFKNSLQLLLDEMDEERKTLYLLRFQEQLSVTEISKIIKIPEGTVKSRIFYLVKELKLKLQSFKNILTYP